MPGRSSSPKPHCLYCRKALRKRTYSEEVAAGASAPTEIHGKKVVAVVRRKPLSYRRVGDQAPPESVSVWCGEWGSYGDSRFCGLNCGYRYAVDHTRPAPVVG